MRKRILRECLRIARAKCNPNHPQYGCYIHFSFIVQDNKIIEYGVNREGTPLEGFGYPEFGKIHSENDAYRKAKGVLNNQKSFEVVNIRLNKQGETRLSKPCECCYAFLGVVGCRDVYFSTEEGFEKVSLCG